MRVVSINNLRYSNAGIMVRINIVEWTALQHQTQCVQDLPGVNFISFNKKGKVPKRVASGQGGGRRQKTAAAVVGTEMLLNQSWLGL